MERCFASRMSDSPREMRCFQEVAVPPDLKKRSRFKMCSLRNQVDRHEQVPEHHGHQPVSAFIAGLWEAHVGQQSLHLSPLHRVLWSSRGYVIQTQPRFSAALPIACFPGMLCSSSCSAFAPDLKTCFTPSSPENCCCQPSAFPGISIAIA